MHRKLSFKVTLKKRDLLEGKCTNQTMKLFLFGWVVDAAICSAVKPDAQQDWDLTNLLMHICLVALVAGARQTD